MEDRVVLQKGQGNFYAGIIVGEWLYYSSSNINGLFKKNIYVGEPIFICRFDKYNIQLGVHENVFRIDNKLFFLPFGHVEKIIAIYDLNTGVVEYTEIPASQVYERGKIASEFIDQEEAIWVVPCAYDAILRIDKVTYKIKRYDKWPRDVVNNGITKDKFSSGVFVDDKLYLCPYDCTCLVVLDIKTEQMYTLVNDVRCQYYKKILFYQNGLYLIPENISNKMLICDLQGEKKREQEIVAERDSVKGIYHAMICVQDDILWMFPYQGNCVMKYNLKSGKSDTVRICIEGETDVQMRQYSFESAYESDGMILVSSGRYDSPYLVVENDKIRGGIATVSLQTQINFMVDVIERKIIQVKNVNGHVGKRIYDTINKYIDIKN